MSEDLLTLISCQTRTHLENSLIIKKIFQDCPWAIDLLHRLLVEDCETFVHSARIAFVVSVFPFNNLETLVKAALLHDVGKLALPAEIKILMNSEKILSPSEKEEVKKHVRLGFEMIFPHDSLVATIVLAHHEFHPFDPYPTKRVIDSSELFAQQKVLALCDVVDALLSKRSYKKSWTKNEVVDYLKTWNYFTHDEIIKVVDLSFELQSRI